MTDMREQTEHRPERFAFGSVENDRAATRRLLERIMKYRGKRRSEVTNPYITARDTIVLAKYIDMLHCKIIDLGGHVDQEDLTDVG